jgi:hypothetical protein
MVVLTLIWLPRLRGTHASAGARDHQANLEQPGRVAPGEELGAGDSHGL